eukprot:2230497-Amphidinium_carterae.1
MAALVQWFISESGVDMFYSKGVQSGTTFSTLLHVGTTLLLHMSGSRGHLKPTMWSRSSCVISTYVLHSGHIASKCMTFQIRPNSSCFEPLCSWSATYYSCSGALRYKSPPKIEYCAGAFRCEKSTYRLVITTLVSFAAHIVTSFVPLSSWS